MRILSDRPEKNYVIAISPLSLDRCRWCVYVWHVSPVCFCSLPLALVTFVYQPLSFIPLCISFCIVLYCSSFSCSSLFLLPSNNHWWFRVPPLIFPYLCDSPCMIRYWSSPDQSIHRSRCLSYPNSYCSFECPVTSVIDVWCVYTLSNSISFFCCPYPFRVILLLCS